MATKRRLYHLHGRDGGGRRNDEKRRDPSSVLESWMWRLREREVLKITPRLMA